MLRRAAISLGVIQLLGSVINGGGAPATAQPATTPVGRQAQAMAYFGRTSLRHVYMFGGTTNSSGAAGTDDMYYWDGSTWQTVNHGSLWPCKRHSSRMVWDAASGVNQLIMFGGSGNPLTTDGTACDTAHTGALDDTWAFNGTTWTLICWGTGSSTCNVPAREGVSLAYDRTGSNTVFLFGGTNGSTFYGDTWELPSTLGSWTSVCQPTCSGGGLTVAARASAMTSWDGAIGSSGAILVYGGRGNGYKSDGWYYSHSGGWTPLCGSCYAALSGVRGDWVATRSKVVMFGGNDSHQPVANFSDDTVTEASATTFTCVDGSSPGCAQPASGPSARTAAGFAYDVQLDAMILFGGANATTNCDDTWVYNGTWSNPDPGIAGC